MERYLLPMPLGRDRAPGSGVPRTLRHPYGGAGHRVRGLPRPGRGARPFLSVAGEALSPILSPGCRIRRPRSDHRQPREARVPPLRGDVRSMPQFRRVDGPASVREERGAVPSRRGTGRVQVRVPLHGGPRRSPIAEMLGSDPLVLEGNFWADGTIRVAGREYNGLLEDAHLQASELTCLSCHSMHEYEAPDTQLDPEVSGNRSCLNCHVDFADEISEHTRHLPESSGSECMNCHMPHTTYGLFSAMRSHRIDNPSVQVSVDSGRPNACNLCHLDQTLEWSSRYLKEWYGQPLVELDADERSIAASVLWVLKGDAAQRTILAWHLGWDTARRRRAAPGWPRIWRSSSRIRIRRPGRWPIDRSSSSRVRSVRIRLCGSPFGARGKGYRSNGALARIRRTGSGQASSSHPPRTARSTSTSGSDYSRIGTTGPWQSLNEWPAR